MTCKCGRQSTGRLCRHCERAERHSTGPVGGRADDEDEEEDD